MKRAKILLILSIIAAETLSGVVLNIAAQDNKNIEINKISADKIIRQEQKAEGKNIITTSVKDPTTSGVVYPGEQYGGQSNEPIGENSVVVGGYKNKSSGNTSSVFSGRENEASGTYSSISGGVYNVASGTYASVSGGGVNTAIGERSSIAGGGSNTAQGNYSSIFGGLNNISKGYGTTIIGGRSNITIDTMTSSFGGQNSVIRGKYSVGVAGGSTNADYATAIGANSISTSENGLALGYQSVQNSAGTISFGHDKGDVSGYTVEWQKDSSNNVDYAQTPNITEATYDSAYYNRLVKVADGIDDHDVTTLGQVKKLVAQAGGTSITGSDDVTISSDNTISIAKNGQIASGDSGIVTGDTVYQVTNKLNAALTDQNTSITAATNKITSLNTSMETLRNSMVQMNTSISNTIADLPSSLGNFINKDLSNLSTDGQNTLKSLIKSEIKNQMGTSASNSVSAVSTMDGNFMVQAAADTSYVDNAVAGKADKAELNKLADTVATKADKKDLDALATKVDTKADKTYVDTELAKKADQSTVDAISTKVDTNAKNIASNSEAIKGNTSAIADLKENKADVSGANIDVGSWREKLGTGKVASGDAGLVTGGTVFSALEQKADIGYVNAGFQSMGAQMQEMNQSLTRDINKVGAGAAALAGLHPQDYDPDNKLDFAVGYGHYHNANATAFGMYYRPNAVTTLSLAGTIGNGDPMLSAGLSFKLGMGKHVEKIMITKDDFNAMQNRMADQDEEIANQKEKIEQLEVMVKQLMTK